MTKETHFWTQQEGNSYFQIILNSKSFLVFIVCLYTTLEPDSDLPKAYR